MSSSASIATASKNGTEKMHDTSNTADSGRYSVFVIATIFAVPSAVVNHSEVQISFEQQTKSELTLTLPATLPVAFTRKVIDLFPGDKLTLISATVLSTRVHQLVFKISYNQTLPNIRLLQRIEELEGISVELVVQVVHDDFISAPRFPIKLALFDLDSTLIDQEVIDELARSIGITHRVSAITERAMAGELNFAASLTERVALLEGVRADVWEELKKTITFAEGARELCRALAKLGVKMGVVSGGFVQMAEWVGDELGLEWRIANNVCRFFSNRTYHLHHEKFSEMIPFPCCLFGIIVVGQMSLH